MNIIIKAFMFILKGAGVLSVAPYPHHRNSNQVSTRRPAEVSRPGMSAGPSGGKAITGNSNHVVRMRKNPKWDGTLSNRELLMEAGT